MTIKEFMENGTQEQIEKLRACKTAEELLALAKEFGVDLDKAQAEELAALFQSSDGELSDEALELVTGGDLNMEPGRGTGIPQKSTCLFCGGKNVTVACERSASGPVTYRRCPDCHQRQ